MLDLVVRCAVLGVMSAGTLSAPADVIPLGDCSGNGTGVVLVASVDSSPDDNGDPVEGLCAGRLVVPRPGPLELEPVPRMVRRV